MRRGDAGVLDRAATQWTSTVNPPRAKFTDEVGGVVEYEIKVGVAGLGGRLHQPHPRSWG